MEDSLKSDQTEISNLQPGTNPIPSISLGETGYNGLIVLGGDVFEECQHELRYPQAVETFKKMSKDGAIAPALELVEMLISRADWSVKVPKGYEEELKDKAIFIEQCVSDMDHTFQDFIKQASSFNKYGFSVCEKVFRYRRKADGSRFDDGLIGLKKLPLRSQDSIDSWKWSSKGREIAGFWQKVNIINSETFNGWDFVQSTGTEDNGSTLKFIPRKKYLHFRNSPEKDSPYGKSPLVGAWQAWRYKQAFQEAEAIGVSQDANGFKVLYLPPQYLAPDASEENKAVYAEYKKIMANIQVAKQSGLILPLIVDDQGNKMFEFDIKSITGQKSYDTDAIIKRYTSEILSSLFADFLALGSNGGGSFSLAESKLSVIEMAIESRLNEIKAQLNHDLIPQLFALNGWSTEVLPYFTYGKIGSVSLDEVGKFVQRVAAVGMLPKDAHVINWLLAQADIPYRVDENMSVEELSKILTPLETGAAEGMASGLPSGTGNSTGNNSATNSDNAA